MLLHAIKSHLKQNGKGFLTAELPDDPMNLVELGINSIKNVLCMEGECHNCKESSLVDEICEVLESCDLLISFSKWATIVNFVTFKMLIL